MEKIIDRFDKYMEVKGLNDYKVTKEIGISNGLIGKSRNEGRDMSRDILSKVLLRYKDLSSEWLMFGKGDMLIKTIVENKPTTGLNRAIDRFDQYMPLKGLNDNKVTEQLELTIGVIGKSRKENRDLSRPIINAILKFYTDLSREWLMSGKGNMLITADKNIRKVISEKTIEMNELPDMKDMELELLKKMYAIQTQLLEEVRKDRDRLAGIIQQDKPVKEHAEY